jgi:hypothetical protein
LPQVLRSPNAVETDGLVRIDECAPFNCRLLVLEKSPYTMSTGDTSANTGKVPPKGKSGPGKPVKSKTNARNRLILFFITVMPILP